MPAVDQGSMKRNEFYFITIPGSKVLSTKPNRSKVNRKHFCRSILTYILCSTITIAGKDVFTGQCQNAYSCSSNLTLLKTKTILKTENQLRIANLAHLARPPCKYKSTLEMSGTITLGCTREEGRGGGMDAIP